MNSQLYSKYSEALNSLRLYAWLHMITEDEYYYDLHKEWSVKLDLILKQVNNKECEE